MAPRNGNEPCGHFDAAGNEFYDRNHEHPVHKKPWYEQSDRIEISPSTDHFFIYMFGNSKGWPKDERFGQPPSHFIQFDAEIELDRGRFHLPNPANQREPGRREAGKKPIPQCSGMNGLTRLEQVKSEHGQKCMKRALERVAELIEGCIREDPFDRDKKVRLVENHQETEVTRVARNV